MTTTPDPIAAVHELGGRMTKAIADLHGLVVNDCLTTQTVVLDASGAWSADWPISFGSVAVHNGGAGALTVTTNSTADAAPVSGVGVAPVPAGCATVLNMAGRTLSLYGTPGARVVVQVFTKAQPPAWANLGQLP
jgi:hypothetical protein